MKNVGLKMVSPFILVLFGLVCRNLRSIKPLRVPSSLWIKDSLDSAVSSGLLERAIPDDQHDNPLDNQTYIWYGNQWVPPRGVPMYTREDMNAAFSQFDTLWIGDSTGRRAYATLFALMNSTISSVSIPELNDYRIIDVNKYSHVGRVNEDSCTSQREAANEHLEPGFANMWTNASLCRRLGQRSFDFIRADCLRELSQISQLKEEMKRYTLVFVAMGLHDALKPRGCALGGQTPYSSFVTNMTREGPYKSLERIFYTAWEAALQIANTMEHANIHDNVTTAVLWRTSGFDSQDQPSVKDRALYLNQLSSDLFHNKSVDISANGTMALVDWGRAIFPRSFRPDKIAGDITAHYGLEARMLMAQMTTQQVSNLLNQAKVHRLRTHHRGYN